ncbi:FixH family protein [Oceanibaculum indicum]|nr:FixH family protein [Oceanibaculum indicum]
MSMTDRLPDGMSTTGEHRRGRWYPWLFVGFFAVVFAVNAIMIGIALSTWTGLETRDHYRKGLAYNDVIDRQAAQQARGWQVSLGWTALEATRGELKVTLQDGSGNPINGAGVVVELRRPTDAGLDRLVPLVARGDGFYAARETLPAAGNWNARLVIRNGDDTHIQMERLWIAE